MAFVSPYGPINRPYYGASWTGCIEPELWKKLVFEWYGLTPMPADKWTSGARHPAQVVGKRVPVGDRSLRLWDHARAWRDSDGVKVVTLEPWGSPFERGPEFEELAGVCVDLGISTVFEGRSPYGASYILFLKRTGSPLRGLRVPGVRDLPSGFTSFDQPAPSRRLELVRDR